MDNRVYWVHLQRCIGYSKVLEGFLEKYASAREFYEMGQEEWKSCDIKGIKNKAIKNLRELTLDESKKTVAFCDEHSIHVITPEDKRYPKNLLKIPNFPCVLYVRGNADCLNSSFNIAVIGSRTPCVYGENAATNIVKDMANKGIVIVSGGAMGVDSIAHNSAIENGMQTVLVLGHGHGTKYLMENSELRKKVSRQGALVTEYPPYTPVGQGTFPERNRIISGMSEGVVIIEAAERSGTFSTANHAKKQGKLLFVLPGDIESGNFSGSNMLIKDGATPVFSAADVLNNFGFHMKNKKFPEKSNNPFAQIDVPSDKGKTRKQTKTKSKADNEKTENTNKEEKINEKIEKSSNFDVQSVSKNAGIVYNIMSDGVCELDEITRKSALEVRNVLTALVELEMAQAVIMTAPNKYELKS